MHCNLWSVFVHKSKGDREYVWNLIFTENCISYLLNLRSLHTHFLISQELLTVLMKDWLKFASRTIQWTYESEQLFWCISGNVIVTNVLICLKEILEIVYDNSGRSMLWTEYIRHIELIQFRIEAERFGIESLFQYIISQMFSIFHAN